MAKIALLCSNFGQVYRGAEVFVQELSTRLGAKVYPNVFHLPPDTQVVISTNGRLDVVLARLWTWWHGAMLIIPGQSGFGWDDKLNLLILPDVFVGLTEYQCSWAKKINPFVRVVKIPNGVDLTKFRPDIKPRKLDLKRPIVLNVGAKSKSKPGEISKRQDLLLTAARKAGLSVLFIGKGTGTEVSHDQMPGLYTACDLFSYPTSPQESFGIVLLEAMASGLPVVATDDPIRREIIGDAGLFVDPVDTTSYAMALKKALSVDWGDKPRRQAAKFSWDQVAEKYHQLCQKPTS